MEGRVLGKGLGFKYRALISSIHASIKETPLTLPRMEKIAIYELGRGLLPDTKSDNALILDFPASRAVHMCPLPPSQTAAFPSDLLRPSPNYR